MGDLVAYDWNNGGADGFIDHLAIVTYPDAQGGPPVTQHSVPRENRYRSWDPSNNTIHWCDVDVV